MGQKQKKDSLFFLHLSFLLAPLREREKERDRKRERKRETEKERKREREEEELNLSRQQINQINSEESAVLVFPSLPLSMRKVKKSEKLFFENTFFQLSFLSSFDSHLALPVINVAERQRTTSLLKYSNTRGKIGPFYF